MILLIPNSGMGKEEKWRVSFDCSVEGCQQWDPWKRLQSSRAQPCLYAEREPRRTVEAAGCPFGNGKSRAAEDVCGNQQSRHGGYRMFCLSTSKNDTGLGILGHKGFIFIHGIL